MVGEVREGNGCCCAVVNFYNLVQVGLVLDKGVTLFTSDTTTILHLLNLV